MAELSGDGLSARVSQLADGIGNLVQQHLRLARLELKEDARRVGKAGVRLALVLPFLAVGYALLCVSVGLWLARWLSVPGGLAVVGGLHLVGAGLLAWRAWAALDGQELLGSSVHELERSAALLSSAQSHGLPKLESTHAR